MSRIIIPGARTASPARRLVLPDGLLGRASLWFDGVDDRVTGSIPVALSGSAPWTLWARVLPQPAAVSDAAILAIGNYVANQYAALRLVASGGQLYLGGVTTGATRKSAYPVQVRWYDVSMRFAGGAGGNIVVTVDGEELSGATWSVPALTGAVAYLGRHNVSIPYRGAIADARVYDADIGATGVSALRAGAGWDANLVRRWSCETPGFGATCREEVGGTDDAITGALWSPVVPFRRQRSVEDVPAAALGTGTLTCTVSHQADLDPAAGSFSFGLWPSARGVSGDIIAQKDDGAVGWILDFTAGGALRLRLRDGAVTITVTGSALLRSAWGDSDRDDRHVECTVDRAGGYAYLAVNSGPPARTTLGALGSIANVADLILGAGASGVVGGLNDAVFHKGAAWTWDKRDALYYVGKVPSGAIAWPMREGAGVTAVSQPAGYNGTLSAASWTTVTRCKARTAA